MKKQTMRILGFAAMALGIVFLLFNRNASLKESRKAADELQDQVDSLFDLNNQYIVLQKEYAKLYHDMERTKGSMSDLKLKLERISDVEKLSIREIHDEIRNVLSRYDSLHFRPPVSYDDLDSLFL